jgi:hypothetical protein
MQDGSVTVERRKRGPDDCTLCCWEGHSTLCYAARGCKGQTHVRHPSVKPLDLRITLSRTNRKNKTKASTLPQFSDWCNRCLRQQLISEFSEPIAGGYIASCLLVTRSEFGLLAL